MRLRRSAKATTPITPDHSVLGYVEEAKRSLVAAIHLARQENNPGEETLVRLVGQVADVQLSLEVGAAPGLVQPVLESIPVEEQEVPEIPVAPQSSEQIPFGAANMTEREVVNYIDDLRRAEHGYVDIALRLNREGIPHHNGKEWSQGLARHYKEGYLRRVAYREARALVPKGRQPNATIPEAKLSDWLTSAMQTGKTNYTDLARILNGLRRLTYDQSKTWSSSNLRLWHISRSTWAAEHANEPAMFESADRAESADRLEQLAGFTI